MLKQSFPFEEVVYMCQYARFYSSFGWSVGGARGNGSLCFPVVSDKVQWLRVGRGARMYDTFSNYREFVVGSRSSLDEISLFSFVGDDSCFESMYWYFGGISIWEFLVSTYGYEKYLSQAINFLVGSLYNNPS